MKMVAAAKLRRAQSRAESARPYAERMAAMIGQIKNVDSVSGRVGRLLHGTGKSDTYLLVVFTSDRGLCGGFNSALVRSVRQRAEKLKADGKTVEIVTIGRKGRELLGRGEVGACLKSFMLPTHIQFSDAVEIATFLMDANETEAFDVCELHFNEMVSVISQTPKHQTLFPGSCAHDEPETQEATQGNNSIQEGTNLGQSDQASWIFEPDEDQILEQLLPRNVAVQIFGALLESAAGEHAARMTAMDNATRNADDMIKSLSLVYNRSRQAAITKELIEIISGAEAL